MSISARRSSPLAFELQPPARGLSPLGAAALMIAIVCLAAGTSVAARFTMIEFPAFSTGCARFGIAGLLLMLTDRFLRARKPREKIAPADWRWFLLCATLCVPVNQATFLGGVKLANASHAALFYALSPVLMYIITLSAGHSRFTPRMGMATLLAFAGAGVVALDGLRVEDNPRFIWGDALLFCAVTSWAVYSFLSIRLARRYGAMRSLAIVCLLGAALYSPTLLIDGRLLAGPFSPQALAGFAYLVLLASYTGYLLWYVAITRVEVNRLTIATNTTPILAVTLAYLLLNEPISRYLLLGLSLILIAITLANWDKLKAVLRAADSRM